MDAQKIADQLKQHATDAAKIQQLIQAIDQRHAEVRERLETITAHPGRNPTVAAAILDGPQAMAELEDERDRLKFEFQYLDALAHEAVALHRKAHLAELRTAIPLALRKYPTALSALREALARLDAAITGVNRIVETLGAYEDCGTEHPLSDEQLADLLTLRNDLWTPRHLRVLFPDHRGLDEADAVGNYPLSWPLIFTTRENGAKRVRKLQPSDMPPRAIT